MTYVADALDDTKPAQSDLARYSAAELRAIKTVLKANNTAVNTTLPNADTALGGRIDALTTAIAEKTVVSLVGAGNFTVPAGVTKLHVRAGGGGRAGVEWGGQAGASYSRLKVAPTIAPTLDFFKTVTPGDIIPYSVGVNETVKRVAATYWDYEVDVAATDSTFGDKTAYAAPYDLRYDENVGHIASAADCMLGKMYPLRMTNSHIEVNPEVLVAGTGAYITVSY